MSWNFTRIIDTIPRHEDSTISQYFTDKTVCLVGPAATLEKLGDGAHIDSHDVVCRMNHHLMSDPELFKNHGSRNDVVFSDSKKYDLFVKNVCQLDPDIVCFMRARSQKRKPDNKIEQTISQIQARRPEIYCFQSSFDCISKWSERVGCHVNTGLLSVIFLLQQPIRSLHVTGFDFYQNKKSYFREAKERQIVNIHYGIHVSNFGMVKEFEGHPQKEQIDFFRSLYEEHSETLSMDDNLHNIIYRL